MVPFVATPVVGSGEPGHLRFRHASQQSVPAFIAEWGSEGSDDGQFNGPALLAVDTAGHIYVPDRFNHRIQKFDGNGKLLRIWGGAGNGGKANSIGPLPWRLTLSVTFT